MTISIDQFLSLILPDNALYCAAAINPQNNKIKQHVCWTPRDVAIYCLEANARGYDAYYAMTGFENNWHDDPSGERYSDGTPKKVFRKQHNAKLIKSFWLDLDCGIGKDYTSQDEAIQAIDHLITITQLPPPFLVNSGNGIHCYWVLEKPIAASAWKKIALLFAAVVLHAGVRADASCTTDSARILRPVETHNFKRPKNVVDDQPVIPKPVFALTPAITLVNIISFINTIKKYATDNNVKVQPSHNIIAPNQMPANVANNPLYAALWKNGNFQAVMGHMMVATRDKDADRIIRLCEQVRSAGTQSYPNWFNMMTVMNCCPTGRETAQKISSTDSRHTDLEFLRKYDKDVVNGSRGPASCQSFDLNNPGICPNCPYFNKIVTPAELGRIPLSELKDNAPPPDPKLTTTHQVVTEKEPLAAPLAKAVNIRNFVTYPLEDPRFIMREGQGLIHIYEEPIENSDPIRKERTILDSCFYLLYAIRTRSGLTDQQMTYVFQITSPYNRPRQASLSSKDFGRDVTTRNWFFNNQMLPTKGNEELVNNCMWTYLAKLQLRIPCIDMKERFGWSEAIAPSGENRPTFVVGNRVLSANQPTVEVALPGMLSHYAKENIHVKGTLEGWKAVPEFYQNHNIIWGQLGIAFAFGAPLMRFAPGVAHNGVANFYSSASGTGKTTLQQAINSVWGHQEAQLLNTKSTANSLFRIAGMRNHLPICINEVTNTVDMDLSDLVFQLSEGREKSRLSDGGKDLLPTGSWSTLTIMSAHNTVFDKMQAISRERDGEIKRVLELEVPMENTPLDLANDMVEAMKQNHGHAGAYFIQHLLDHPTILKMIPKAITNWVNRHIASQDERYWMNTIAVAVVAAQLTNTMKLTRIDIPAITDYAMGMVKRMRLRVMEARKEMESSLSDYLADNLRDILVVASAKNPNKMEMPTHLDNYIRRLPIGELGVRIEVDERLMYIRVAHLRNWCKQNKIHPMFVLQGHLTEQEQKTKRMSTGVNSLPPVNSKCWIVRVPADMDLDKFTDVESPVA